CSSSSYGRHSLPRSYLIPYTTLFRSGHSSEPQIEHEREDVIGTWRVRVLRPRRRSNCSIVSRLRAPFSGRNQRGARQSDWHRYQDRKSTRLNSSHVKISYAVFCLKKK